MAYSIDPKEAYLSQRGIENIKQELAKEIFRQDQISIYQKQTEYRDQLRQKNRESISEIVAQINAGEYQNPRIEELLLQLSDRLSRTTGKKVYGYLKADVKAIVDQIVRELAGDENIRKLYDLWYEQREDVLRTYTDTFPGRVPLEKNKEFKSIRNAVIQEALKITPFIQRRADAGQRLRIGEEQPFPEDQPLKGYEFYPPYLLRQQEEADDDDNDSAILGEHHPTETVDENKRINSVEPVCIPSVAPTVARSVSALMAQLARLFQEQDQQRERKQQQQIDRKQHCQIDEKKQAMGIRD